MKTGNKNDKVDARKLAELRVLSAMLRSGAGEKVLLEEVALREPVMPVSDGFIGGFIRIEGV
jgi:hypothetical protein